MWRVFGVRDVFADVPEAGWSVDATAGSRATDRTQAGLGQIPADLREVLTTWRAQLNGNLDAMFRGPISAAERLRRYKRDLELTTLPEFDEDPYPLWLWIRHSRTTRVRAKRRGAIAGWKRTPSR